MKENTHNKMEIAKAKVDYWKTWTTMTMGAVIASTVGVSSNDTSVETLLKDCMLSALLYSS